MWYIRMLVSTIFAMARALSQHEPQKAITNITITRYQRQMRY